MLDQRSTGRWRAGKKFLRGWIKGQHSISNESSNTYSHASSNMFLTLVFMNESANWSFFTMRGDPSSFQKSLKMSNIFPVSTSLGRTSTGFPTLLQEFFFLSVQCEISISIMFLPVFQSTRSRTKAFSVGKFSQGSRSVELCSISFAMSSLVQRLWIWKWKYETYGWG